MFVGASKVVASLGILLLVGGPARAETALERAEAHIAEGNRLRRDGNAPAAYEQFLKAYQIARNPRTAAQLGLCEFHLKRWIDAEAHLDEALQSTTHPWLNANRETINEAVALVRKNLGRVEITGRPAGAEVVVAGAPVGRLPLANPVRVETGTSEVKVSADGYRSRHLSVYVKAGDVVRVNVELDANPTSQPSLMTSGPESGTQPAGDWKRPAAWATAGVAVALAGGAVAALLVAKGKFDEFDQVRDAPNTADHTCTTMAPEGGGGRCSGLLSAGSSARTVAVTGFALAGAAAVGAAILFVTSASPQDRPERASLSCSPTLGVWGGACAFAF